MSGPEFKRLWRAMNHKEHAIILDKSRWESMSPAAVMDEWPSLIPANLLWAADSQARSE